MICPRYPGLGKFFRNQSEMADAGCMSRVRCNRIIQGHEDFTKAEEKAILNAVLTKIFLGEGRFFPNDLAAAKKARQTNIDTVYGLDGEEVKKWK